MNWLERLGSAALAAGIGAVGWACSSDETAAPTGSSSTTSSATGSGTGGGTSSGGTGGQGTGGAGVAPHDELGRDSTQYVLANPGHAYIAYASAATGDLGLASLPAGDDLVRWLDTASGTTVNETATLTAGDQTFTRPGTIGAEVALYVALQ